MQEPRDQREPQNVPKGFHQAKQGSLYHQNYAKYTLLVRDSQCTSFFCLLVSLVSSLQRSCSCERKRCNDYSIDIRTEYLVYIKRKWLCPRVTLNRDRSIFEKVSTACIGRVNAYTIVSPIEYSLDWTWRSILQNMDTM